MALCLSAIALIGCDQQTPTASSPIPVDSYMPPAPAIFSGASPPTYNGIWNGEIATEACNSSVPGYCRINPVTRPVQIEFVQKGTAITATINGITLTGWVTFDSGVFARSLTEGLKLEAAGEALTGIFVADQFDGSVRIRSDRDRITSLRNQIVR